jgi:phage FluMu protein gp41
MIRTVVATIPGGYRVNGDRCHQVRLRELTGQDQIFLIDAVGQLPPAQWTTEVLHRCLSGLDGEEGLSREQVRSLNVGDREALLLQLRQLSLGDRLDCVLNCPSTECQEKLDLELRADDLLQSVPPMWADAHEAQLRDGDATCSVRFRLVTGEDQEAVVELARHDHGAAGDVLLRRCVESVGGSGTAIEEIPSALREQLGELMSELDPQAEVRLSVTCSACGRAFDALFDVASYLFHELQAGMRNLLQEVHLLAYHYHWGLAEILRLSARTRHRFLRLLEAEFAGASG